MTGVDTIRQSTELRTKRCEALVVPALLLMTWIVFGQVWLHQYTNYDDEIYASQNPYVQNGLTWDSFRWAFSSDACTISANWFPLTWLSLILDGQLYGDDPGGFHLTNLLVHTANVGLLYALLLQMTGARWKSAFAAAVFAVHPLRVESVAWISERKGLLSTFFGLIAIWAYARYVGRSRATWYIVSLAAYVLSLMSKQMLVTLPFLLLLLDYWPLSRLLALRESRSTMGASSTDSGVNPRIPTRLWTQIVWEKTPYFALAIVFCVVAVQAQGQGGSLRTLADIPLAVRFNNAVLVYLLYIGKVFWPVELAPYYPHPGEAISLVSVLMAAGVLLLITLAAYWQRRSRPFLLVGWLWYAGTLIPVCGLVQVGGQRMADRYTYISLLGLFIALAWFVPSLSEATFWRRKFLPVAAGILLLALMWTAWIQTSHWRNSVTLFKHALAVTERNQVAHNNLGLALRERGQLDDAIDQFGKALRIEFDDAVVHNNLGLVLRDRRQLDQAIHHFRLALKVDPDYVVARVNLGIALCLHDRKQEGVEQFRESLLKTPDNLRAHTCLAYALRDLGQLDEAKKHADFVRTYEHPASRTRSLRSRQGLLR